MFGELEDELRRGNPIGTWRRTYHTGESRIAAILAEAGERYPEVLIGSYPSFHPGGPEVEIVVKSSDAAELATASSWLEKALAATVG